jgi:hypothetical protein
MGLVDDQQPDGGEQVGQLPGERRVGQSLGRDQQHVQAAAAQVTEHLAPLVDIGGVDRRGPQPGPLRGRDLIAHQSQQR